MNAEQKARLREAFAELGFTKQGREFILDLSKISKKEQKELRGYSLGGTDWGDPNMEVIYMHGGPSEEEPKYEQPLGEGQFRFKPIKCTTCKIKRKLFIWAGSIADFDPDSITAAELQMLICRIDRDYNAYITVCKFREDARRIRSLERKYKRAREKYRAAKKQLN